VDTKELETLDQLHYSPVDVKGGPVHDCTARHDSNTIIKFADDTTVVGLITNNNETAYTEEVSDLALWCQDNNLFLNVIKTKEMIVGYRKRGLSTPPFSSMGLQWSRLRASSSLVSPCHHQ
jgi:hypothetical protein